MMRWSLTLADFNVTISNAVGANGQYIDRNLYNVNSGATLDVNVGSQDANWINDRENLFSAVFKSSNTSSINKASVLMFPVSLVTKQSLITILKQ